MRFLFKALLAATALIPAAAASAQEGPGDRGQGRERPSRAFDGGERRMQRPEGPRADAGVRVDAGVQGDRGGWRGGADSGANADIRQRRWEGRAERGPGDARPREWQGGDNGGAPQPRQWEGRRDAGPAPDRPAPQVQPQPQRQWDGRLDGQGDARFGGDRRWEGRDRPRVDPGRGDGRFDRQDGWNQPGREARRYDDRRGWDQGWNAPRRYDDRGAWNRTWRNDSRYDWNRYRTQNRSAYRLPRYYAPANWGYGYRRYSAGVVLNSLLWGENYWIDDPYSYRLPQAYGPYRWVRYYDDALLVDIRTGRVVDAVYDIFW